MKFFWKIYFSFTILLFLSFGLFGTWMIQLSFEKSYQKALEEGGRENRMFQLSFEMNLNSMKQTSQSEGIIPITAYSVIQNLADSGEAYRIYNDAQELLYENKSYIFYDGALRAALDEETPCGYRLLRSGAKTCLMFACRSVVNGSVYYLENVTDISGLYEERESFYDWYTMIMLILAAVTAILVFLAAHMLTRSIAALSQTARRFTRGDYEVRASPKGRDEIAELASDFNDMADTISEKMDELRMQARKQEDFTASFAHELKTPLTSIIGYADMLRTIDCTKEETLEAANYIFQQGKRLESLSFKLLELIVADRRACDFCPLSLERLIREAVRLTEGRQKEKEIRLVTEIEEAVVEGERDLLISVFTNLLDNAGKAVRPGGCIRIRGRQRKDAYVLCVQDDGCGMERQDLSRITEAFYMADKSRARKEGGAGLGMTLCSRILSLHGIRWKIFSRPGKGTAVVLQFCHKGRRAKSHG